MPQLISDDGQIATFQMEDGTTQQVASQFAQPYITAPPSMGGEVAPVGAIEQGTVTPQPSPVPDVALPAGPGPEAELTMPVEDLRPGAAPPLPNDIGPDLPQPSLEPVPEPAPDEITMEPLELNPAPPPPNVLPQGKLNTPTQVANALNQDEQAKAESAYRQAEIGSQAAGDIVQGSADLDENLARMEQEREFERQERAREEKLLTDDYTRRVDKYATWKVDPNRGMSAGREAWAWIGVALAGIGRSIAGRDPAQNPALDQLMAGVKQRIDLQMAERDQLGTSIDMKKGEIADFRAATKTRMGERDLRMAGELERYARLVDRIKTRAGSEVEREAANQLAASIRQEATSRKANAIGTEAQARARARAAAYAAQAKMRADAEKQRKWMAEHNIVGIDPATGLYIKADGSQTVEGREQIAKTTKAEADAAKAVLEGSPQERERVLGVGGLKRKDGSAVLARNPEEAAKLTKQKAATDTASQLIDKMIAARDRHGFSSELLKSDEWRTAQNDYAALQLEIKNSAELGVLAGPDMEIIGRYIGTNDPTELRDIAKGLENSRANLVNKYNATLKANDPAAQRYEPVKSSVRKATEATVEQNIDIALAPLSDLAKADPEEKQKQVEARAHAFEEAARQLDSPSAARSIAQRLHEQHAAGEVDKATYDRLMSKLAKRTLKLDAEQAFEERGPAGALDTQVKKIDSGPASGKGWEERLLLEGDETFRSKALLRGGGKR